MEKLDQQKEDSSNRMNHLKTCLIATLDEFKQCIYREIPAYTEKEERLLLKNEIEMLNEENSKLKHDMSDKEILIKSLRETWNKESAKQIWQT